MNKNLILISDSYKYSHYLQYPPGTEHVISYIEPRGFGNGFSDDTEFVFFGLQMFIHEYLTRRITKRDIDEAEAIIKPHGLPFNRAGWERIINLHGGFLPLHIEALQEGTVHGPRVMQVKLWNTDPQLPWVTSFAETAIIRAVWYPSTVATLSREVKKTMKLFLNQTSDNPEALDFMLHDFGARGVSSHESAMIGGAAHLINFKGTDTVEGILALNEYYAYNEDIGMPAFSVPAAEHSTIISWGIDGEEAAYRNMIEQFGGEGKIYSVVSDSYDFENAVRNMWCGSLKEEVLKRGGRLVVRPDSGDPTESVLLALEALSEAYGFTVNSKGYKVLNPVVRVIQGDGMSPKSIDEVLWAMMQKGFSAENVVFGMGGGLLQSVGRDSLKYAMKPSRVIINGEPRDVFKKPSGDPTKVSKAGDLFTVKRDDVLITVKREELLKSDIMAMLPVYSDGGTPTTNSFSKIRERAAL